LRQTSSDEHIEQSITQEGFYVCDLLNASELEEVRKHIKELGFGLDIGRKFRISVTGESLERKAEIFEKLCPVFQTAADRFLQAYKIVRIVIFDKCPGGHRVQVHPHPNLIAKSQFRSLTIWVPTSDTSAKMGTLYMIGGSHNVCSYIRAYDDYDFAFEGLSMRMVKRYSTPMLLTAGQAVVFDDRCLHWSPPNRSSSVRTAIQLELIPSETDLTVYYRTNDQELAKYALQEKTYRLEALTKAKPDDLTPLGTQRQPKISYTNREFVSLMQRFQPEAKTRKNWAQRLMGR